MLPFYLQQPLRFSCTQCGQCCATAGEYYVYLGEKESERIRASLQLSRSWFRRRYLQRELLPRLEDSEQLACVCGGIRVVIQAH